MGGSDEEEKMSIYEMKIHPANNVFPMMKPDELEDLARSIKECGQIHPIAVQTGTLIDGKCRLAACKIAGVEPEIVELDVDPYAHNLSMNVNRAHYSPSVRAMGTAMMTEPSDRDSESVKKARKVLASSPDKADLIVKTSAFLEESYQEIVKREEEGRLIAEKTEWLRQANPDLLEMVQAGRFGLDDAIKLENSKQSTIGDKQAINNRR